MKDIHRETSQDALAYLGRATDLDSMVFTFRHTWRLGLGETSTLAYRGRYKEKLTNRDI